MVAGGSRFSRSSAVRLYGMDPVGPGEQLASVQFVAAELDLAATLDSGQAFRLERLSGGWEGVVGRRWVRLSQRGGVVEASAVGAAGDWGWIRDYLGLDVDLSGVYRSFPRDAALEAAVRACRGLRLLRQDPWECLASFLLSSTKQIRQIRQVVALLCERAGGLVEVPVGHGTVHAFPTAAEVVQVGEEVLRGCRMGFRAPHLMAAAEAVVEGRVDLAGLSAVPLEEGRERLMRLPGVGPKIADCVLLFSCGQARAFPVDVWVARSLCANYFGGETVPLPQLRAFAAAHFGPWAGYAQQYLFHYTRLGGGDSG